jgi:voltage-gated potassium channel
MARTQHTARRLADLDRPARRKALLAAVTRTVIAVVLILGIYFILPVGTGKDLSSSAVIIRGVVALGLFGFALAMRFRRIQTAELPEVRAVEGAVTALFIFLVLVAMVHLSVSATWPGSYSEQLTSGSALYFTTTVFATVGFGDIVAVSERARMVVTGQMIIDLAVLALIVRVLFTAAKSRLEGESVTDLVKEDGGLGSPGGPAGVTGALDD